MNTSILQQLRPKQRRRASCSAQMSRRSSMRRSKSEDHSGDSLRHLVDYSTTRATHDAKDRSACRGPVINRQLYNGASPKKKLNLSARNLDWNMLSSTMDLSNETADSNPVRRTSSDSSSTNEEPQQQQQRPDLERSSCSARLRLNLAKSASYRPRGVPAAEGEEEEQDATPAKKSIPAPSPSNNKKKGLTDDEFWGAEKSFTRPEFGRSKSVGAANTLLIRRSPVSFHAKFA